MNVNTARFGNVVVDDDRVITFPHGLLGFAGFTRYALLQPDEEGVFFWLQSLDAPELAFVVSDPCLWVRSYRASIRPEQMDELQVNDAEDVGILVIVNRYEQTLTANIARIRLLAYFGAAIPLVERATIQGDVERGVQFIGQAQGLVADVPAAGDLVLRIVAEAEQALERVVAQVRADSSA